MNKKKLCREAVTTFLILIAFSMIWAKSSETLAQTKQERPGAEIQTVISSADEASIKETIALYCKSAKESNFSALEKTVVTELRLRDVVEADSKAQIKTFLNNNPDLVTKNGVEKSDSKTRKAVIDSSPVIKFAYHFLTEEVPGLIYEKQIELGEELRVSSTEIGAVAQAYFLAEPDKKMNLQFYLVKNIEGKWQIYKIRA